MFTAPGARAKRLPDLISSAIADRFGLRAPVVVRTAEELRAVASANPWLRAGMDPQALHVVVLAERPFAVAVFGTVSTMRNWRTVLKLCEMVAE